MDDNDDSVNNMVSNLPLLFANGYPTSLEKITETQIQKFIPFMVQCSLGNINVPGKEEYNEPEWWPEDIEFSIPITRPKKFQGDLLHKMKEIVKICYHFHKSIFLLRFCNDLASYEHTWLRFINNHNSTTSLYDRRSNKLLVTFRNENMTYDQPPQKRKCLLQQKTRTQNDNNQQQQMVEQALFDIYLCDNCDAELYSYVAFKEHEKICTSDDDDVILCNSPTPECENFNLERSHVTNSTNINNVSAPTQIELISAKEELRQDFLLNFQLLSKQCSDRTSSPLPSMQNHNFYSDENNCCSNNNNLNKISNINDNSIINSMNIMNNNLTKESSSTRKPGRPRVNYWADNIIDRNERSRSKITRNNRTIYALTRCPNIPFSSPAGQLLIKTFKSYVSKEYLSERLDRVERFCTAPVLQNNCQRPIKFFGKQRFSSIHSFNCTYKKPQDNSKHRYTFPRRQYFSQYRIDSLKFLNDLILKKRCRPITVRLRKITDSDIKRKRRSSLSSSSNNSIVNSDLNIKLIRDQSHGSTKWKITHQQQQQQQQEQRNLKLQLQQQQKQQQLQKLSRQKHNTEKLIIVDTIDLCSSDEELEQNQNDISTSEIYINGGLSIAQNLPVQLNIQKNLFGGDEFEINVNDENDDDDDDPQIIDECPAQPEHPMVPLQINLLTNSNGKPPRLELQTILQKLHNDSEITVTPLKKILDPLSLTPIESSSNIILSGASISNGMASNIIDEIRKQNKFEGNFLASNIPNSTKPLQPSVFLFSNYTANSTGSSNTTPTTTMILQQQINNDLNSNSNNQENLVDHSSNNLHKSKNTEDIWLPNNNINNINNNISNITTTSTNNNLPLNHIRHNNLNSVITNSSIILNPTSQLHSSTVVAQAANVATNKLLQLQQLIQYVDNNDVINKINSPNRTLSIDLTL